jgi:long-chain acyl-CoA synthetase
MSSSAVKTICDCVLQMPGRDAVALQVKRKGSWQEYTWREYFDLISVVGCGLLSRGIKPKDRIAIMSNTRLEWSVCDFAIMGVQGIVVPIYQTVTQEDLKHILKDSEAKILFVENAFMLKQFEAIKSELPLIETVICFESPEWSQLMTAGRKARSSMSEQFENLCRTSTRQDVATIIYTSGTTGLPKGVVLTHEQVMSEISEAFPHLGVSKTDISLSFLPYAHILGRIENWGHLFIGFQMAYAENIEKIRSYLLDIRPTILVAVPRIFEKVYSGIYAQLGTSFIRNQVFQRSLEVGRKVSEYKIARKPVPLKLFLAYQLTQKLVLGKVKEAFGGRLRFAVSGGAPISSDIAIFFHSCGILILEGYGLTETTAAIAANTPFNYHFGSVGRPIGDVQIKIAEDGEILVKSKKVMREYLNDPESTEKAFTNGWFHTGDIGEILASGDLRITDRKKDLIKTAGGKYISPQKLENLLKELNLVSNTLIHGDQRKYVVALLTLDPVALKNFATEKNIVYKDLAELSQHPQVLQAVRAGVAETNAKLAHFETIKRFSVLPHDFTVEAGELTPSLKVKRKVLDLKYRKQIDALYS